MAVSALDSPSARSTATPWGPAGELRSRQLRPGPGHDADTVERNQRERLYGAMVAAVAEHGYDATRVIDVIGLAGVSKNAFYRYFDDKLGCFLATLDAIAELAGAQLLGICGDERRPRRERLRALLEGFVELILAQPAAARVWLVEIDAAGPPAVARTERLVDRLEHLASSSIADRPERGELPVEAVRALLGGMRQIVQTRLRHGREGELPALVPALLDWVLGYRAPPARLRGRRRPPAIDEPTSDPDAQRRRILAALTELVAARGYHAVTIGDVARRAAISLTTFYDHFDGKRAAFLAAIDDGDRRLLEVTLPAYGAAPDWPRAARDAIHAHFAFYATYPALARIAGMWALAGGEGPERHDRATARLAAFVDAGRHERPDTSAIVAEAVGGTIAALLCERVRRRSPETLYEVAGMASFLALAPFVGADEACALANEGWQPLRAAA